MMGQHRDYEVVTGPLFPVFPETTAYRVKFNFAENRLELT